MPTETLGLVLKALRESADLSQEELAAKAQVSRGSVQNWENDRSKPRRAEFRRLAAALRITPEDLKARTEGQSTLGEATESVTAAREDLVRMISDLREEIQYLNPKYERNRPLLVEHLERKIAELQAQLKALGDEE